MPRWNKVEMEDMAKGLKKQRKFIDDLAEQIAIKLEKIKS